MRLTTVHGIHFLHSRTGNRLRVSFLIVFAASLAVMSYQLYNRLSTYLRTPIYMEVRDRYVDSIAFPDIVICSSQQIRWSKLVEYKVFKDFEFVPILDGLDEVGENYSAKVDRFRNYLIISGYCEQKTNDNSEDFWCDNEHIFKTLNKAYEKGKISPLSEVISSLRLARNLFNDEGLYRLEYLTLNKRKWPEFRDALRLFASFSEYNTSFEDSQYRVMERPQFEIALNKFNNLKYDEDYDDALQLFNSISYYKNLSETTKQKCMTDYQFFNALGIYDDQNYQTKDTQRLFITYKSLFNPSPTKYKRLNWLEFKKALNLSNGYNNRTNLNDPKELFAKWSSLDSSYKIINLPEFTDALESFEGFLFQPEELKDALRLFEIYQNSFEPLNHTIMKQLIKNRHVFDNRSKIIEHYLNSSFDYESFRQHTTGEPEEIVAACRFRGRDCNKNITKANVAGQVCFKMSGANIGHFHSDGIEQQTFHLLIDAHALDVITELKQPITVTIKFMGLNRQHTSPTEQVILKPAQYSHVILEKQKIENEAECDEKKLQLFKTYSRESYWVEKKALFVKTECGCFPPLYLPKNANDTCRTTEQVVCAQETLERKIKNNKMAKECGNTCLEDRYVVLQQMSSKLSAEDLQQFANLTHWSSTEMKAFANHFNIHSRVFKDLYNLQFDESTDEETNVLKQNISAKCERHTLYDTETYLTELIDDYLKTYFRFQQHQSRVILWKSQQTQSQQWKIEFDTSVKQFQVAFENMTHSWDRWQNRGLNCITKAFQLSNIYNIEKTEEYGGLNTIKIAITDEFNIKYLQRVFQQTIINSSDTLKSFSKNEMDYIRFMTIFAVRALLEGHTEMSICTDLWEQQVIFSLHLVNRKNSFLPDAFRFGTRDLLPYYRCLQHLYSDSSYSWGSDTSCINNSVPEYFSTDEVLNLMELHIEDYDLDDDYDDEEYCSERVEKTGQSIGKFREANRSKCNYYKTPKPYENNNKSCTNTSDLNLGFGFKLGFSITKLLQYYKNTIDEPLIKSAINKWVSKMIDSHVNSDSMINSTWERQKHIDELLSQIKDTRQRTIEQTIWDSWPDSYTDSQIDEIRKQTPNPSHNLEWFKNQTYAECWNTTCTSTLHEYVFNQYNICVENELKKIKHFLLNKNSDYYRRYRQVVSRLQRFKMGMDYNLHSFIRLDVSIGEMTETVTTYHNYNVWTFLSEVGGTLGLYLGATFLTFFELAALVVERCRKYSNGNKKKKQKNNKIRNKSELSV